MESPDISLYYILKISTEFIVLNKRLNISPKNHISIYVKWYPPTHPFDKLNIDGSFNAETQNGGSGDVFKNSKGDWILGFS